MWESVSDIDTDLELMQYTGLKDKNGKEVYEGDILEVTNIDQGSSNFGMSEGRHKIFFQNGGFMLEWETNTGGKTGVDIRNYSNRSVVVGNIYTNPEALQEGEK